MDARALRDTVRPIARGLLLFGHLHVRRRDRLVTPSGTLDVVCARGRPLIIQARTCARGSINTRSIATAVLWRWTAHALDGCDVHLPGGSACPRSEHDMKYRRTLHEAARGRTASVRRLLTDQTSRQEFDLAVLRRVRRGRSPESRGQLQFCRCHTSPPSRPRGRTRWTWPTRPTPVDRRALGSATSSTVGSLSPADSVQVAFASEGRIVATTRTSPDGEVEFAAGAAANSLGVLRTGETPPVDAVAEIERKSRAATRRATTPRLRCRTRRRGVAATAATCRLGHPRTAGGALAAHAEHPRHSGPLAPPPAGCARC